MVASDGDLGDVLEAGNEGGSTLDGYVCGEMCGAVGCLRRLISGLWTTW